MLTIREGKTMDFQTIDNILGILSVTLMTVAIVGTVYGVISVIRLERGAK